MDLINLKKYFKSEKLCERKLKGNIKYATKAGHNTN